jgi:tetratricopeptide (TPR) repeat protein
MRNLFPIIVLLTLLASCNNNKSDNQTASIEMDLKESIAQHPDSLLLKEQLIQYYRDSANYDQAIASATEYLKKDSNNARLWKIMATLQVENEDSTQAINALEHAFRIEPGPEVLNDLGTLYAETKNPKAIQIADLLLWQRKEKSHKSSYFIRGLYYNYAGEKTKAIANMDSCLAVDYTYMLAYREKAIALYDLAKYDAAISVLNKALTLQNNFDEGYYWRGMCLEKLGKKEEALASYRSALLYSPDYLEAKEAMDRIQVKN